MTIYYDNIIRKVPITVYPIDIWTVAEILQNLAHLLFEGRPNAQESAAQALGLAWVCLASGLSRFMTQLKILHELPRNNLQELGQGTPSKPNQSLTIRTFFGKKNAVISKTLYSYLLALPRTNPHYIFGRPLRTLRLILDQAVKASKGAQKLGKITFLTLMQHPHEHEGHRFKGYEDRLKNTP